MRGLKKPSIREDRTVPLAAFTGIWLASLRLLLPLTAQSVPSDDEGQTSSLVIMN
jgi:hypothetical protein